MAEYQYRSPHKTAEYLWASLKLEQGKLHFSYGHNCNYKFRHVRVCLYTHTHTHRTLPLFHMPEGHSMVCFYTVNSTCLALPPTQHNSTMILLQKANCLAVDVLNIPEDLIFNNQDIITYNLKLQFCFTLISSLEKKYHAAVCSPCSPPPHKKDFWTKQRIFMQIWVFYKLFLLGI